MTYYDAAVQVLRHADQPLTTQQIVEQAVRAGLLQPLGKTPVNTMSALLYVEVRDNPSTEVELVSDRGPRRSRRGSVRWQLRHPVP